MAKILVVEDENDSYKTIEEKLGDKVKIIRAKTLLEARKFFKENSDIDIIIMDFLVPDGEWNIRSNTIPLVKEIIKNGFEKPIIAAGTVHKHSRKLIDAGATHSVEKFDSPELALRLLSTSNLKYKF